MGQSDYDALSWISGNHGVKLPFFDCTGSYCAEFSRRPRIHISSQAMGKSHGHRSTQFSTGYIPTGDLVFSYDILTNPLL
jgi:hypothetical protein